MGDSDQDIASGAAEFTRECFVFEGFCNRLNCLASALLRWPDGFILRWMVNAHCPVEFGEVFRSFGRFAVSSDPGSWREYGYANDDERLCHYFLSTNRGRPLVRDVYRELMDHCRLEPLDVGEWLGESIAVHYREHFPWEKASLADCVRAVEWLGERTGVNRVLLASDDDLSARKLAEMLEVSGLRVKVLGAGFGMSEDLDRGDDKLREFVRIWRTLTQSRWAVSNALSSTVLDASRALGNEVWTFGNLGGRIDQGCAFFGQFGFDLLVAEREPLGGRDQMTVGDLEICFSEECGPRVIAYSLFGSEEIHLKGMLRNLKEAREVYPGYRVVVFVDETVTNEVRSEMESEEAVIYELNLKIPLIAHRFLPAMDAGVEVLLVRDADSSLGLREKAAVDEWLASGKRLHVMRDHPHHVEKIMAGMWGCRGGTFGNLAGRLDGFQFSGNYGEDQDFLAQVIWDHYGDEALVHDSHGSLNGEVRAFPSRREGRRFVGERVDGDGVPVDESALLIVVD